MKPRSLSALVAFACLALSSTAVLAGDPKIELRALVDQIQTKLKAGQRTEAALAENLAAFDTLLASHTGEVTDDVAQAT